MKTGPYQFPDEPYPGVFIRSEDCIAIAGTLRMSDEESAEREKHGAMPKRFALGLLLEILESCTKP